MALNIFFFFFAYMFFCCAIRNSLEMWDNSSLWGSFTHEKMSRIWVSYPLNASSVLPIIAANYTFPSHHCCKNPCSRGIRTSVRILFGESLRMVHLSVTFLVYKSALHPLWDLCAWPWNSLVSSLWRMGGEVGLSGCRVMLERAVC